MHLTFSIIWASPNYLQAQVCIHCGAFYKVSLQTNLTFPWAFLKCTLHLLIFQKWKETKHIQQHFSALLEGNIILLFFPGKPCSLSLAINTCLVVLMVCQTISDVRCVPGAKSLRWSQILIVTEFPTYGPFPAAKVEGCYSRSSFIWTPGFLTVSQLDKWKWIAEASFCVPGLLCWTSLKIIWGSIKVL